MQGPFTYADGFHWQEKKKSLLHPREFKEHFTNTEYRACMEILRETDAPARLFKVCEHYAPLLRLVSTIRGAV